MHTSTPSRSPRPLSSVARLSALALLLAACTAPAQPADARARASDWLKGLGPAGVVMSVKELAPGAGFVPYCEVNNNPDCPADRGDQQFFYAEGDRALNVAFPTRITPTTTFEEMGTTVQFVALDKLSPPGLSVPGWKFRLPTPMSSFNEGVAITGFKDGRINLRIQTKAFALVGTKQGAECVPPADGAMPPDCIFEIRQDIPLDLTLDLPLFAARPR